MRWWLVLALLLLLGGEADAAVLWFDGGEIGNMFECSQQETGSGRTAANAVTVKTGKYSIASQSNLVNSGFCISKKGLGATTLFARFQFQQDALPIVTQNVARFLNAAQTDGIELCQDTGGHLCWRISSGAVVATGSTVLTTGAWYLIEMKAVIHASAGGVEVKINGATEFTSLGTNTSGVADVDQLQFGPARNENSTRRQYYDDVMICDTSYCPLGGTIARQGKAGTPTYDAWTKTSCAGSVINGCWSDTPYDATSFASSATANDAQTMLVYAFNSPQTSPDHGTQVILSGATINACKTGMVGKMATASSYSIRRRIGGSDTDTATTLLTTDSYFDDGIWTTTLANLLTAEIGGVHGSGTNTMTVYDMWLQCDYSGGGGVKHKVTMSD